MVEKAPKGSGVARSLSDEATRVDSSPYVEPDDVELLDDGAVIEAGIEAAAVDAVEADERTLEESLNSPVSLPKGESIDDETKVQEVRFDDEGPLTGGAIPSGDDFSDSILDESDVVAVQRDTSVGFDDPDTGPYVIPDTVVHQDTDRESPDDTEMSPARHRAASADDDPATVETSRPPSQIEDLADDVTSEEGLYERIERGAPRAGMRRIVERVSQDPGAFEKPWNQASVQAASSNSRAKSMIQALSGLPVGAKAALGVLPVIIAGLVWALMSSGSPNVEALPGEPEPDQPATPVKQAKTKAPPVAPPVEQDDTEAPKTEEPSPQTDSPPTPAVAVEPYRIEPAPKGSAYVVSETKVLSQPGETQRPIAIVSTGALVRVYDTVDGWALVRATQNNTAGYIPEKRLTSEKPVAVIAEELKFQRCHAEDESFMEACLDSAERQHGACVLRCGGHPRCEKACQVALGVCAKNCRGTPAPEPEPAPTPPEPLEPMEP